MKIIYNNFIPLKGYKCINLFGILFARKGVRIDDRTINHESIHTAQQKELLYIIFYILYLVEYVIKSIILFRHAYRDISFEQEAYYYEKDMEYLKNRKHYTWIKYLFKTYKRK